MPEALLQAEAEQARSCQAQRMQVVGQCNGHIEVRDSASGCGTSIEIHLPMAASLAAPSAPAGASAQVEGGGEAIDLLLTEW